MSPRFRIRSVEAVEGPLLRSIRLRALQESPGSFGAVYADEEPLPPEAWSEIAERTARGESDTTFVGTTDSGWVGMVRARLEPGDEPAAYVYGLWVEPASRREGVGTALIEAVTAWARSRGAKLLTLWVAVANADAVALYRRLGFEQVGPPKSFRRDASIIEIKMARRLD